MSRDYLLADFNFTFGTDIMIATIAATIMKKLNSSPMLAVYRTSILSVFGGVRLSNKKFIIAINRTIPM